MEIEKILQDGVQDGVFSGGTAAVLAGPQNERIEEYFFVGRTSFEKDGIGVDKHTVFDLASLTKPLATTLSVLCLIKEGKIELDNSLEKILNEEIPEDKKNITLSMLLNHTAGLPPHREFFKNIQGDDPRIAMRKMVLAEPLVSVPGESVLYSDLGFLLLGWMVEQVSGERLDLFVEKKIYNSLGLAAHLFFATKEKAKAGEKNFACCENCLWRNRILCGEVSDENCFALGGVAGHAGLFGDIVGVSGLVSHLLDQWKGRKEHPAYKNDDLKQFLTRQQNEEKGTWALGFDTPSSTGSSAGKHVTPDSIGHLGFTGTSFWIDPVRDAAVVLLTNRVHPTRENDKIREFRPRFYDAVWQFLDGR